ISATTTVESTVLQLRRNLPRPVGCVYWRATCEPSTSVFTPWYLGISSVPDEYHEPASLARRLSLDYQFNAPAETFEPRMEAAWWKFKTLQHRIHEDYDARIARVRPTWTEMESRELARQARVEAEAMRLWENDREAAVEYLTTYCADTADEACREADRLAAQFAAGAVQHPHAARLRQTA
ncbi:MAG TPA: C69 family dipeptidase, partial [Thermoguttaceae bacterium]|nr:C69 family dipeptidase [Thermoguttaceae bacterium]